MAPFPYAGTFSQQQQQQQNEWRITSQAVTIDSAYKLYRKNKAFHEKAIAETEKKTL